MSRVWNPETLVGTRLGSCVLQRPLGEGGMGAVYLAQQERPRRLVAVKVLRPQLSDNRRAWPIFLARFRREADATAALDHGNIVPIYEFGEQDGTAYLVMPYLPDGSLANLLAREGPLPLDPTLAYIGQAAAALDYAHAHDIIHRDVKPSNLLLHPDGRLLLADFGIARPLDRSELPKPPANAWMNDADEDDSPTLTHDGAMMGTPHFMAPEQIRGEAVGPATDVYALAALTYTMLSGQLPFGEGPYGEVLQQQLLGRAVPLRSLRPDLPARVEQTIAQGLSPDPSARPTTAGEFAQALRAAAGNRTIGDGTTIGANPQGARRGGAETSALHLPLREPFPTHEAPTIFDAPALPRGAGAGGGAGATPEWPGGGGYGGGAGARDWNDGPRRPRKGVIVLGAIAVLMVALLLIGVLSSLANGGLLGSPVTGARATPTATPSPSPTATPSPTPTATPVTDWLSVSPTSVSLDCSESNKATVTLTNRGSKRITWSASVQSSQIFGGVSVSPTGGRLDAGQDTTITITNTSKFFGGSGAITFKATASQAGAPAMVSYQTSACGVSG
jgi:serine/threonine protein kinase